MRLWLAFVEYPSVLLTFWMLAWDDPRQMFCRWLIAPCWLFTWMIRSWLIELVASCKVDGVGSCVMGLLVGVCARIKFIKEGNNKLLFYQILISRKSNNKPQNQVHWKATYTIQILLIYIMYTERSFLKIDIKKCWAERATYLDEIKQWHKLLKSDLLLHENGICKRIFSRQKVETLKGSCIMIYKCQFLSSCPFLPKSLLHVYK